MLLTKNPTSNQNPDATLGGLGVSGISNTGHTSTTTNSVAISNGTDNDEKSARWFGFTDNPVVGLRLSTKLKMDWTDSGSANASDNGIGGSGDSQAQFMIEYSVNGGSSWNTITSSVASASSPGINSDSFTNNNSANINLSVNQDITQVQVRVDYNTSANASGGLGNSGNASVDATLSNIKIEITLSDSTFLD